MTEIIEQDSPATVIVERTSTETVEIPMAQGPPGASGVQAVLSTSMTLTPAQIMALGTAPAVVVPAPGAGKFIHPFEGMVVYVPGATPYAGGGQNWTLDIDGQGRGFGWGRWGGISLAQTVKHATEYVSWGGSAYNASIMDNKALVVWAGGSGYTAGNGSVIVSITYRVVTIP